MSLNISVSPLRAMVPAQVTFDADPTDFTPDSWLWDFGDGYTSNSKKVTHTYLNPGIFDIVLSIVDTEGVTHTETLSEYVAIFRLDISSTKVSGEAPLTVKFSFTSYIPDGFTLGNYSWDFGDGSSVSTDSDPVHTFTTEGNYTVVLSAEIVGS